MLVPQIATRVKSSSAHTSATFSKEEISDKSNQHYFSHNSLAPLAMHPNPQDHLSSLPLDLILKTESFLPIKKGLNRLAQVNKTLQESSLNNLHWKRYLKPDLQTKLQYGDAYKLYLKPQNRQDKYVPIDKLGTEYLQNKGRFFNTNIFKDKFVLNYIQEGRLSIIDALKLTPPAAYRRLFNNIEKSHAIEKLIKENKLSIQRALNLTRQQVKILENGLMLNYIIGGQISVEDAILIRDFSQVEKSQVLQDLIGENKLSIREAANLEKIQIEILENKNILQFINTNRLTPQQAVFFNPPHIPFYAQLMSPFRANNYKIFKRPSVKLAEVLMYSSALFGALFLTPILVVPLISIIILIGLMFFQLTKASEIERFNSYAEEYPYIKTTFNGIAKYVEEEKLTIAEVLMARDNQLKNLGYSSIQNHIDLGKMTVQEALSLNTFRAKFFNLFKTHATGCYLNFGINQRRSEFSQQILQTKFKNHYIVCKNDINDNLTVFKIDHKGNSKNIISNENSFQIDIQNFMKRYYEINANSKFRLSREQFERLITCNGGHILD